MAIWLNHLLQKGMSRRPASTSAVSTRRSITPPGGTASTSRMTSPPQSPRPLTVHQQAAASGSSQFVPTSEVNAWLHAEPWSARSRKLLRSDVSNITHVEERIQKGKEMLKVFELCLKEKIYMSTSSRKLTWLFDKNAQLRNDYLKLKQTWKQEREKREVLRCLIMAPKENWSLKDWSCVKLINGLIRFKEKGSFMWRTGNEKPTISRQSYERLRTIEKICEETRSGQTN